MDDSPTNDKADINSELKDLCNAVRSLEGVLKQHIGLLTKMSNGQTNTGGGSRRQSLNFAAPTFGLAAMQPLRETSTMIAMGAARHKGPIRRQDKVTVFVRVVFLKIGEIDTLKEKYAADVFIQARWREPALDGTPVDEESINWETYWQPQISVENVIGEGEEASWFSVSWDREGRATVFEKKRMKGDFLEFLELNKFPFDTQDLTITVTTEKGEDELSLQEDLSEISGINVESFVAEQEWRLHSHIETWTKCTTTAFKNQRHKHPAVSFACKATRRPGFFLWNIFFVMCFICSLSFATFTVDTDFPQNRLQLSFILLLTTITFKFVVNQSLPRISYLTYLDKYILTSMSILCFICVWHACVPEIVDSTTRHLADRIALSCLGSAYVVFHLAFSLWVFCSAKKQNYRLYRKAKEHAEKVKNLETVEDNEPSRRNSNRTQNHFQTSFNSNVKVGPLV